ncbi:MAG: NAD(P)H-dependent oxidoreductase [bacterium]|nr:NAD(P)H-dependent oxidoreductase [bacterium]
MKIVGFAGSLRSGSYNKKLLRAAKELSPEGVEFEIVDIADIPLYNGDFEEQGLPESVTILKQKIADADGIVIATPEYNHSFSGVVKNAIDWVSRPPKNSFNEKPVAIISSSDGMVGGTRAQYHLRQVLSNLNMYAVNKPEVIIPFELDGKFDAEGNFTDEKGRQKVRQLMENLVKLAEKLAI